MMRTFQFDLYQAIARKREKSVKRCASCQLNETREEGEQEKNFVNSPGPISFKAVFIVENHAKRCWLTRGLNIIAEENICAS